MAENGFRSNFRYAVLLNHKKSNLDLVVSKLHFVFKYRSIGDFIVELYVNKTNCIEPNFHL